MHSAKEMTNSVDGQHQEIHIEGLENFSFINQPQEELELKDQFEKFIEQMQKNEV
jgi:hypothetical protein